MRYRELLRKNGPLTLIAMSGVGFLRAARRMRRAGLVPGRPHPDGTYTVEINRDAGDLPATESRWPTALTALAEHADVSLEPTPGRPTMRLRAGARAGDPDLARRVREAKQLLETGEVLRAPTVARAAAPGGEQR